MRRRELIKRLKTDRRSLRDTETSWFGNIATIQANDLRRQKLLHGLEAMLSEIIEKLEQPA